MMKLIVAAILTLSGCASNRVNIDREATDAAYQRDEYSACFDRIISKLDAQSADPKTMVLFAHEKCKDWYAKYEAALVKMHLAANKPYFQSTIIARDIVDDTIGRFHAQRLTEIQQIKNGAEPKTEPTR